MLALAGFAALAALFVARLYRMHPPFREWVDSWLNGDPPQAPQQPETDVIHQLYSCHVVACTACGIVREDWHKFEVTPR